MRLAHFMKMRLKPKNRKWIIPTLVVLTGIGCVCIGFASWAIPAFGDVSEIDGDLESETIEGVPQKVKCISYGEMETQLNLLYEENKTNWPGDKLSTTVVDANSDPKISLHYVDVDTRYYKNAIFNDGSTNHSPDISLVNVIDKTTFNANGSKDTTYVVDESANKSIRLYFNKPQEWTNVYCYLFNPLPLSDVSGFTDEETSFGLDKGYISGNASLDMDNAKLVYPSISITHEFQLKVSLAARRKENDYDLSDKITGTLYSINNFDNGDSNNYSTNQLVNSNRITSSILISDVDTSKSSIDFVYKINLSINENNIKTLYRENAMSKITFIIQLSILEAE